MIKIMCIYIYIYIYAKLRENPIRFQLNFNYDLILRHVSHLSFLICVPIELLSAKVEECITQIYNIVWLKVYLLFPYTCM